MNNFRVCAFFASSFQFGKFHQRFCVFAVLIFLSDMSRVASIVSVLSLVAAQPVPLPNLPDGFRVGTSGPVVETFMDMLCPDW
jgi:hypothetical protein